MTRELKLALIVGFAIVLTVAILVSDHLSKARQATLADVAGVSANRIAAKTPEEPIKSPDELLPASLPAAMSVTEPTLTRGESDSGLLPPSKPTETAPALTQSGTTSEPVQAPVVIGQGSNALQTNLLTPVSGDATIARRNLTEGAPAGNSHTTPIETAAKQSPAGDAILQKAAEKKPEVKTSALPIGPNDKVHVIAENESLYAIAKKYYGSGNLWRELAAANAGRVSESGAARVGTKIVIPSKDVLLGKATPDKASKPQATKVDPKTNSKEVAKPSEKVAEKATPKSTEIAKTRDYVVKPGDSLGRIAARELGSAKKAGVIAALNKMDPDDDLIAGGTLKLPVK
ncbi:MAG: LysM peptidoglycan-binding domain-containing protein [Phycisphaerales bacterium]|nr:LysM peptidoglycan-binding domain-containing protein [Phycisphaerales bacterium]